MTLRETNEILDKICKDEILIDLQDHRDRIAKSRPIGFMPENLVDEELENVNKLIEIRIDFLRTKPENVP